MGVKHARVSGGMILFFVSNLRDCTLSFLFFIRKFIASTEITVCRASIPGLDALPLLLWTRVSYVRSCTSKCTLCLLLCLVYIYIGAVHFMREPGRWSSRLARNSHSLQITTGTCALLGMAQLSVRCALACSLNVCVIDSESDIYKALMLMNGSGLQHHHSSHHASFFETL